MVVRPFVASERPAVHEVEIDAGPKVEPESGVARIWRNAIVGVPHPEDHVC
jgi:hypothetical protein